MKINNRSIWYVVAAFLLLASMACKKKDKVEPATEPPLGPGAYLLRAGYVNGVLNDSFVYNAKGQVIKYLNITYAFNVNMTYNNDGKLTDAEMYTKLNEVWLRWFKYRMVQDAEGMKVYVIKYDIYKGTEKTALDTMLFTLDREERFTNLVYFTHEINEDFGVHLYTSRRNYTNHQLTNYEKKIFFYPSIPGIPNEEKIQLSLDYTVNYQYSDVPNKLYAQGKSNPFLIYLMGEDNTVFAGNMQVKGFSILGSTGKLDTAEKSTTVFADTYYPNTGYIKTRTATTDLLLHGTTPYHLTSATDYYYTPAP